MNTSWNNRVLQEDDKTLDIKKRISFVSSPLGVSVSVHLESNTVRSDRGDTAVQVTQRLKLGLCHRRVFLLLLPPHDHRNRVNQDENRLCAALPGIDGMLVSYPSSEPEYSDGESISDNNDNDSNGNVQDESTPRPGKGARQERRADGDVASSRKRKASVGGAAVTTTMTTTTLTTAAATRTTTTTTTATSKSKPNLQAKSNLPALPPSFLDLYSANVRTCPTDDPAFHGGRKRQTPHVVGNWNTHVYLECESLLSL